MPKYKVIALGEKGSPIIGYNNCESPSVAIETVAAGLGDNNPIKYAYCFVWVEERNQYHLVKSV